MGTVRWYNGRRRLGAIIPDNALPGAPDLFIPKQGALNGDQVPPQPGGLFHGTRVSYLPMTIAKPGCDHPGWEKDVTKQDTVCMDVRPVGGQVGLSVGVDTNNGCKERNDDRIAALDLHELGFVAGVFDGHRGTQCSEYVAKHLPSAILSSYRARAKRDGMASGNLMKLSGAQEVAMISGALTDAFEATDKAWLVTARKKEILDGSTGLVALISHGFQAPAEDPSAPEKRPGTVARAPGGVAKLFIAWAGDCRAVLLRGRHAIRVSEDHRPSRRDEARRCKEAGGTVLQDSAGVWRVGPRTDNKFARELQKGKKDADKMRWFLSTCRGFGDPELKVPDPIITASPEIKVVDLVPEDWAVLLGSDGIFDHLSDQELADVITKVAAVYKKDPVRTAKEVVQAALRKGARDNLTAIVMRLGWAPAPVVDAAAAASTVAGGGLPAVDAEASDNLNIFG